MTRLQAIHPPINDSAGGVETTMAVISRNKAVAPFSASLSSMLLAFIFFAGWTSALYGQAKPTATRAGDLQIGGTFSMASSDYSTNYFRGFGVYSSFDFRYHVGVIAEFHQLNDPRNLHGMYERTYEIGPRYILHYGRVNPYAKALFGRGVFNYPKVGPGLGANLAYNVAAAGGGVDYHLSRSVNLRVDYEYQRWLGFAPNGLTPAIVGVGAAYRFH